MLFSFSTPWLTKVNFFFSKKIHIFFFVVAFQTSQLPRNPIRIQQKTTTTHNHQNSNAFSFLFSLSLKRLTFQPAKMMRWSGIPPPSMTEIRTSGVISIGWLVGWFSPGGEVEENPPWKKGLMFFGFDRYMNIYCVSMSIYIYKVSVYIFIYIFVSGCAVVKFVSFFFFREYHVTHTWTHTSLRMTSRDPSLTFGTSPPDFSRL